MNNIEPKNKSLKPYAIILIIAGVVGFMLTIIFWLLFKDRGTSGVNSLIFLNHIPILISYYMTNSLLVFLSGIFLLNKKKLGVFILILVLILVFGSLLITDKETNLFLWTTKISLLTYIPYISIGVLFFLGSLVINIFKIKKWFEITK